MPPPLPLPLQHTRINLGELKSQIAKKLGPERAQRYFSYLRQLLSSKLSKPEFDKLCASTLGRENIPLHNQLIRSILKNAYNAKVPPIVTADKSLPKPVGNDISNRSPAPPPPIWSNGDILLPSPRKCRSGIRRIKDRPSPLGPNGRVEVIAHQSLASPDELVIRENGEVNACDLKRPVQHHQGGYAEQPAKRQRTEKPSPHGHAPLHSICQAELVAVDDRDDVEQRDDLTSFRGPLQAPLGIPLCPASIGGARRLSPLVTTVGSGSFTSNYQSGELCHNEDLRKRMEMIAEAQGLVGVSSDCANLLNSGLDTYLKRLIRSCVELVGARQGHETTKQLVMKQQSQQKPINGVWPGTNMHVQSSSGPSEGTMEKKNQSVISLQDFKVAMELNPQQLGEEWPSLLEKISLRSLEE